MCFLVVLLLLGLNPPVLLAENLAAQEPSGTKILICMIDRLDIGDLSPAATPNLWHLMELGAIGLLNAPSAGERNTNNTCCTISAGQRIISSAHAAYNFEAGELVNNEPAGAVFFRNTGIRPAVNNIVVSNIEAIKKNNKDRNLDAPGLLGDELHKLGCTTAVIGNSDLPGYYSRSGALLLMDSSGIVDAGKVGQEMTRSSRDLPGKTDYQQVLKETNQADQAVVMVEFGDLSRLDSMVHLYDPAALSRERRLILTQIDNCIGELAQQKTSPEPIIYIISPTPSRAAIERGELLTPFIIVKPGMQGILTGISTRREGIVSSLVIKDSILASLDRDRAESIASSPLSAPYRFIADLNRELAFGYVAQKWFIPIVVTIIILTLAMVFLLQKRLFNKKIIDLVLILVSSIPLTLLLIANFGVLKPVLLVLVFLAVNLAVAALSCLLSLGFKTNPLSPVLLGTIACIALDLFCKLGMLERSMMSYRIMAGSRYYGLGNEYMGVLLASAIVFAAILLQSGETTWRRCFIALLFSLIIFLNAYPRLGTKVGGTITAAIALGYTYMHFRYQHMDAKKTIFLFLGVVGLLLIMAVIDLNQPAELQSHLGHSVTLIMTGGLKEALFIIQRKMQMQWRVLNFTFLSWLVCFSVVAATYSVYNPGRVLNSLKQEFPHIYSGLKGLTLAAVTALIFNDSGITAAASLFIFSLIMIIQFKKNGPEQLMPGPR